LSNAIHHSAEAIAVGDYRPVHRIDHLLGLCPLRKCLGGSLPLCKLDLVLMLQPGYNSLTC
jgi:hypothetical protein